MRRFGAVFLACVLCWACWPALGQSAPDPHTPRWYYNPEGGNYAHIDPKCAWVHAKYLPLQPLPDDARKQMKGPCPYCAQGATPVFSVSGGSGNMPNLQVDVYLTSLRVPQWDDDQVYRIHITDKDRPEHVFEDLLFPSVEYREGLVPLVTIQDLNFDGYPDLTALRSQGASNVFSTHFLYSPADGQYHYEPVLDGLSSYMLYPEQGFISNYIHDSAITGIRELYRIGGDGRPMLYRRASVLYDEQSNWENIRIQVTGYDSTGTETVLMDEVRTPFADEADYRESERKWLALFYEGVPEAVVRGDRGD